MTIKINNGIVKFELVDNNEQAAGQNEPVATEAIARPAILNGSTYEIQHQDQQLLLTVNNQLSDAGNRPYEILIQTDQAEDYPWVTAVARLSSAILQQGGNLKSIADSLKVIFDPAGGFIDGNNQQHISLLAAIGERLEHHLTSACQ